MRILAAGQLVEDIDNYNRIHEMMQILVAKESRENDAAEAFGNIHDKHTSYERSSFQGISAGQGLQVLFKPLSGLLNQNKMLPIRYAPITIELELVDNVTDPIWSTFKAPPGPADAEANNTSLNWSISNVQVKVDVCTLDNALDNSYAPHLLSGKRLPTSHYSFVPKCKPSRGKTLRSSMSHARSHV